MRKILTVLLLVAGCTEFPNLDSQISNAGQDAPYPTLIALDAQPVDDTTEQSQAIIDDLDGRSLSLWSKVGALFNYSFGTGPCCGPK